MRDTFLPYKLIRHVTHPMWPWLDTTMVLFGNLKKADFLVVWRSNQTNEEVTKSKDDDDESIDMEDIEHQGEDEDITTIENNPSKKGKNRGLKRCWEKLWQFTSF